MKFSRSLKGMLGSASMVLAACGLSVGLPTASAAVSPFAEPTPTIAELAPKNALLVVNIPNYRAMRASFDRSSLGVMVKDQQIRGFVKHLWEQRGEDAGGLDAVDRDIETELAELEEPVGPVGLSLTLLPPDADKPADENGDPPPPRGEFLLVADFGPAGEANEQRILAALEHAEKAKRVEVTPEKYEELTIHVVKKLSDPDDDEDAVESDDGMDGDGEDGDFDPDNPFDGGVPDFDLPDDEPMHLVRVGGVIVASSTLEAAQRTADRLRGEKAGGGAVADDKVFGDSLAQHPADPQMYVVVKIAEPFTQLMQLAEEQGGNPFAMLPMDPKIVTDALGISKIDSFSAAARFDAPGGDLDTTFGALIADKKGLISLFEAPSSPFQPPAFAPADASSVSRFTFRFDKLIETARGIVMTLPPEMRQQAEGGLQFFEGQFGPALAALGPDIYSVNTTERPLSAESQKSVMAIKTSDALAFVNAFGGFAPQLGLEPGDFEGNQIYTSADAPFAVGVGFDHVFLGERDDVENAMRLAANPGAAGVSLATDPAFKAAAGALGAQGNIYSFARTRDALEWTFWSARNADKIMAAQMRAMGFTDEELPESAPAENAPEWMEKLPAAEVWVKYLGDTVGVYRSTPDGFRGQTLLLRRK